MRRRFTLTAGLAFAALLFVAVAVFDPLASTPGTGSPGGAVLDCDTTLEGGRHPDIPRVELNLLVDCRPDAGHVLEVIDQDGPFPYPQDDEEFFNREGYLPAADPGAFREYTVDTPGIDHRGQRRIVTEGEPDRAPSAFETIYYTDDHYDTFWRVVEP